MVAGRDEWLEEAMEGVASDCPPVMVSVQSSLYSLQCASNILKCAVHSFQCCILCFFFYIEEYIVLCQLSILRVDSEQCTVTIVNCAGGQ